MYRYRSYGYKTKKVRHKPSYARDIAQATTPFVLMGAFTVFLLAIIHITF